MANFRTIIEIIEDAFSAHLDESKLEGIKQQVGTLLREQQEGLDEITKDLQKMGQELLLIQQALSIPSDALPLSREDQKALADVQKATVELQHQAEAISTQPPQ